ncbi:MAG: PHP-associated domain-containing protein [Candidatus Omnitrophota bacterium]
MVIDFHVHSKYSFDCFLEPSRVIDIARLAGLDGLAIADHDTMAGVAEFKKLAPDLYIIPAQEITTRQGDILGLFLKDQIEKRDDLQWNLRAIRLQGGLAVLAHPFKWPHLIRDKGFLRQFDAIEVFNARNNIPMPYLENFLASSAVKALNLAFVAGSDCHEGFELGRSKTIFEFGQDVADDQKIKNAILEKRVKVSGREVSLPLEIISHFSRNFRSLRPKL